MKGKTTVNMWNKTKGNQLLSYPARVLVSDIVKCSRPMVALPEPQFKATQNHQPPSIKKKMRLRQQCREPGGIFC